MRLIDADALASALNNGRLEEQTGRAVPFNAGVAFALTMVEYAPTIEPKRGEWIDAVPVEEIAGIFGNPPCQYTFDCLEVQGDEFMYDHRGEWCEKNCMHVPCVDCWKQFFEAWGERKDDETD